MFMKPAGNLVGSAQASNPPWSAVVWHQRPVILPSFVALSYPSSSSLLAKAVVIKFSIRSSTHLTGSPVTMDATTEHT